MKREKVTIEDIARHLGCSVSTVSRALNDKPGISEKVKTEIRITALDMGYVIKNIKNVKKTAKSNKSGEVKCISMIVTRANFTDEDFYRNIICEIEQVIYKLNIEVNFFIIDRNGNDDIISRLQRLKPDGAIVFGLLSNQSVTDVVFSGIPMVLVDIPDIHLMVDRITVNNYLGCYDAVTYLIRQGHKRIAFLGDISFSDNMVERYRGCKDCVEKNGGIWIEASGIVKFEMTGDVAINEKALGNLMFSQNPPTAVVCANDKTAFKLYEIFKKMNITVPDDVSVIGFDNIEKCNYVSPPLTSVNVPKFEMGQESVRMLLERIANKEKATGLLTLDTNLVIRESVKINKTR